MLRQTRRKTDQAGFQTDRRRQENISSFSILKDGPMDIGSLLGAHMPQLGIDKLCQQAFIAYTVVLVVWHQGLPEMSVGQC